jgi:hypothetical protein
MHKYGIYLKTENRPSKQKILSQIHNFRGDYHILTSNEQKLKRVKSIVNINIVVHKGYERGNSSSVFPGSTRVSLLILLVNYTGL